jgi:hypothetical protein
MKTIAVDLDGTLAEYSGWKSVSDIGKPIESTVKKLEAEKKKGTRIIIHTARLSDPNNTQHGSKMWGMTLDYIRKWLFKNNIPYNSVWEGEGKPRADEYWDDRAVKMP